MGDEPERLSFISVRNFEKFQHYKDRKPPWIKLYRDLLEDERFFDLTDTERYHLIGLFILASQHDNKIPNRPDWLRHQLRTRNAISLERLAATGWLTVMAQDASGVLAECKQLDDGETEKRRDREEERRGEETASAAALGEFKNVKLSGVEFQKLCLKFGDSEANLRIENLSQGIASKGYKYKSHYATILAWDRRNGANGNGQESKAERITRKNNENVHAAVELVLARSGKSNGN